MAKDSGRPGHSIPRIPEGAPTGLRRRQAGFRASTHGTLGGTLGALATPHSGGCCPQPAGSPAAALDSFVPKPPEGPPRKLGVARPLPTPPHLWGGGVR